MEHKHTSAPWEIEIVENYGCTSYMLSDSQGAEFGDEADANAQLIEAAPYLLVAAEKALALLDSVAFVSVPGDKDKIQKKLAAAINKATRKPDYDSNEPTAAGHGYGF